eukprot:CAMPEP_0114490234 /NCGR_PEP_ID=MMETSP0109-20121206/2327_1 /TAXON_ID=29199 /ORGANISM="Chlorarachnion reptans, Strain CCCM449" /LENGTH=365 /DNA_ID=CAMNT_0001666825 /DNA_START=124 /DNA_END=1221 /DNA_ORIENTATION=+
MDLKHKGFFWNDDPNDPDSIEGMGSLETEEERFDYWMKQHGYYDPRSKLAVHYGDTWQRLLENSEQKGCFSNLGKTVTIMHLDMWDTPWSEAIAEVIKTDDEVEEMILYENDLYDQGVQTIADALRNNTRLTKVRLCHNKITDKGVEYLADALVDNDDVHTLSLYFNRITHKGAKTLSDMMMKHKRIRNLCLWHNPIGDEGAIVLAELLKHNHNIEHLGLGDCDIGPRGAKALAEALAVNDGLVELDIRENNVGDDGIKAIANSIIKNDALKRLICWENGFSSQGIEALQNAIDFNFQHREESGSGAEVKAYIRDTLDIGNRPNTTNVESETGAVIVNEVEGEEIEGQLVITSEQIEATDGIPSG